MHPCCDLITRNSHKPLQKLVNLYPHCKASINVLYHSPFSHPFTPLQFSDNYYRADLIEALTNSLTPAISINNEVRTVDNLNADVRLILEEITRFLNMEKLLPSFRNTITVRYHAECVFVFQRYKVVSEKYKTQLFPIN